MEERAKTTTLFRFVFMLSAFVLTVYQAEAQGNVAPDDIYLSQRSVIYDIALDTTTATATEFFSFSGLDALPRNSGLLHIALNQDRTRLYFINAATPHRWGYINTATKQAFVLGQFSQFDVGIPNLAISRQGDLVFHAGDRLQVVRNVESINQPTTSNIVDDLGQILLMGQPITGVTDIAFRFDANGDYILQLATSGTIVDVTGFESNGPLNVLSVRNLSGEAFGLGALDEGDGDLVLAVSSRPGVFILPNSGTKLSFRPFVGGDFTGHIQTGDLAIGVGRPDFTPAAVCQDVTLTLNDLGAATIGVLNVDNGSTLDEGFYTSSLSRQTFNCGDLGANNVQLTVTNNQNESASCISTITVIDSLAPVISPNINLELDDQGVARISDQANAVQDNCGLGAITITPNVFTEPGTSIIEITATDAAGNSTTQISTVTVVDEMPPDVECVPAVSITLELDENGEATITAEDIDAGSSDNASDVTLALDKTLFTCDDIGLSEVTLTATDASGNQSECSTLIFIEDVIAPTIPADFQIELDENGIATISGSLQAAGIVDNCGIPTITVDQDEFEQTGTTSVEITATDGAGNSTTRTSTVTVVDLLPPTAVCIAASTITLALDNNGQASLTPEQVDNGSTDNFSNVTLSLNQTVFTCIDLGVTDVTLAVRDEDANEAVCSTTVVIEDNIAPTIPENFQIEVDENGTATISGSLQEAGIVDNCGIASLTVDQDAFDETGTSIVEITAADEAGNTSTQTSTVTVVDVIPPDAECIAAVSMTLQLDANGEAFLSADEVDNGSRDNFSNISLALDKTVFTCADLGVSEVTLKVRDEDGNESECSTLVMVEDNLAPIIPTDFDIELDENGIATISGSLRDAGIVDNCGVPTVTVDQDEFDETGTSTVLITATDDAGNSTTQTSTVNVIDVMPPEAECIAAVSITLELNADGEAFLAPEEVDNGSFDNFSDITLALDKTVFTCDDLGVAEVTLIVTDEDGNQGECSTLVIVEDNQAPTIPSDFEIELDENGVATISGSLQDAGIVDNCGVPTVTVDQDEFNETGTATVLITATDDAGNSATRAASVTVVDVIPPVVECIAS